jgi:hypothetical protein
MEMTLLSHQGCQGFQGGTEYAHLFLSTVARIHIEISEVLGHWDAYMIRIQLDVLHFWRRRHLMEFKIWMGHFEVYETYLVGFVRAED